VVEFRRARQRPARDAARQVRALKWFAQHEPEWFTMSAEQHDERIARLIAAREARIAARRATRIPALA
jgi:hypothetical protein